MLWAAGGYLLFLIWSSRQAGWKFGVTVTAFSAACLWTALNAA